MSASLTAVHALQHAHISNRKRSPHHEQVRWTGAHVATDGGEGAGAAAVAAVEVRGRDAAHAHAYDGLHSAHRRRPHRAAHVRQPHLHQPKMSSMPP
jgi:hypothetical protein